MILLQDKYIQKKIEIKKIINSIIFLVVSNTINAHNLIL